MITYEELYDLLTDEEGLVQISLTEDGELSLVAPDEFLKQSELVEGIVEKASKVIVMGFQMGLMMPTEITKELERILLEKEEEKGEIIDGK